VLSPELRKKMGDCAVAAAKSVNYSSVGTMEFLLDADHNFYFMEMNTRVQVEHPVTEMVTGVDIIREQIRSAAGLPLRFKQSDIKINGHAIECRINAEHPFKFIPSPGKIEGYHPPGGLGVRVDSAVYDQYTVLPYYDSMVAKLIVHADNRQEAIQRMARALDEYIIGGIRTTIMLHQRIMNNKEFREGAVNTSFMENLVL
jgi:acetyl-CoA carboxylase biotin carboxylase subunit